MANTAAMMFVVSFLLVTPTQSVIKIAADDSLPEGNETLQYYLCTDNQLESDTTLMLSPGTHSIDQGPSCTTTNINNLTITSSEWAHIICSSKIERRRNFIFLNMTNLTIKNIRISDCGSQIPQELLSYVNTLIHLTPRSLMVFLFSHVTNLHLFNVVITKSLCSGIVAIDLRGDTELQNVSLTYHHSGTGAVFIYTDLSLNNAQPEQQTSLTISNSNISKNNVSTEPDGFFGSIFRSGQGNFTINKIPFITATGLGFHLTPNTYNVTIRILSTIFSENSGYYSPLAFFLYNAAQTVHAEIKNCHFHDNRARRGGAMMLVIVSSHSASFREYSNVHEVLSVYNTWFINNSASVGGGAVYLYHTPQDISDYRAVCDNVTFTGNWGEARGSIFEINTELTTTITRKNFHFLMNDVIAFDNTPLNDNTLSSNIVGNKGLFIFLRVFNVTVTGSSHTGSVFSHNSLSVFLMFRSNLYLHGQIVFSDNRAMKGGAISLYYYSVLFFLEGSRINFTRNLALDVGGAIYAELPLQGVIHTCILRILGPSLKSNKSLINSLDVRLYFEDNVAIKGGNSIYVSTLFPCIYFSDLYAKISNRYKELSIIKFQSINNPLSEIAFFPYHVCLCPNKVIYSTECVPTFGGFTAIPGQKFMIPLYATDTDSNPVSSVIIVNVGDSDHMLGSTQKIRELHAGACTQLDFNLHGEEHTNTSLFLFVQEGPGTENKLQVNVYLQGCPPGFISTFQGKNSSCSCSPFVLDVIKTTCNLENYTVSRPPNSWPGFFNQSISYVETCPPGYCKNSKIVDLTQKDPLCQPGRTGILCGECKVDLSVVFGSSECRKCSNFSLFTIFLYAAVGILLVLLLFLLNITVSQGTINGLIFYVNILSANANVLSTREFLFIWISFLNFELGFPLCFYDGMDEIAKAALQCIFPVYLLLICTVIILSSRFSSKITQLISSHGIQVLATLVYLSFSKMFRYAIDILSFATLKSNNTTVKVWLFDGNVNYFEGAHTIIGIIPAMVTLLFITLFILSMLFLKKIEQHSIKLKPLMDAYAGPFKDKYRFWIGIRLLILTAMYMTSTILGTDNSTLSLLIQLIFLVLFMVLVAAVKPFRKQLVNLLDLFFTFDLLVILILLVYSTMDVSLNGLDHAVTFFISLAFVAFVLLIGYHVLGALYSVPKVREKCKQLVLRLRGRFKAITSLRKKQKPTDTGTIGIDSLDDDSKRMPSQSTVSMDTFVELREPLIDS